MLGLEKYFSRRCVTNWLINTCAPAGTGVPSITQSFNAIRGDTHTGGARRSVSLRTALAKVDDCSSSAKVGVLFSLIHSC